MRDDGGGDRVTFGTMRFAFRPAAGTIHVSQAVSSPPASNVPAHPARNDTAAILGGRGVFAPFAP